MARPPGPRYPPVVQSALFSARPIPFLDACRRRYGNVFSLHIIPFGPLTYLADPAACKEVFTGDTSVFKAGQANQFMAPTLGDASLLLLDEDEHLRTRKLMLPPFHGDAVKRYAQVMAEIAAAEIDAWPTSRPFATRPSMQRITLEVILRTVFGIDEAERLARLRALLTAVMDQNPAYLWFEWMRVDLGPRSPYGRFLRLRDRVDAILFDEIARRRRDPATADRVDVLSLLIRSGLPDGALRDELMTLLLAGHETTATGLAWACERLVRHPDAMARAREDESYLEASVKEVLRIRPVVLDVARVVNGPAQVAGFDIEPGTMVIPAIASVQRADDVWPDAPRVQARALPRRLARALLVDPVRGRGAPLPRRGLRPARDEGRAQDHPRTGRPRGAAERRTRDPAAAPRDARALPRRGGPTPSEASAARRACG